LPSSDLGRKRARIVFLALIIAGVAIASCSLAMALTVNPSVGMDLYVMESTLMSVGMVMLCMGIVLMKNGEEMLGTGISELERKRMHDDMHEQVMSEMRLSPKDLEIQKMVQGDEEELFK
jgi:hypothetical protein